MKSWPVFVLFVLLLAAPCVLASNLPDVKADRKPLPYSPAPLVLQPMANDLPAPAAVASPIRPPYAAAPADTVKPKKQTQDQNPDEREERRKTRTTIVFWVSIFTLAMGLLFLCLVFGAAGAIPPMVYSLYPFLLASPLAAVFVGIVAGKKLKNFRWGMLIAAIAVAVLVFLFKLLITGSMIISPVFSIFLAFMLVTAILVSLSALYTQAIEWWKESRKRMSTPVAILALIGIIFLMVMLPGIIIQVLAGY